MMRLLPLLLFVHLAGFGQVVITPQIPPTGLVSKSQLWNLSILNPTADEFMVRLDLSVTDLANGEVVFTAASRPFNMGKGLTQVHLNNVLPVTYSVSNPNYGTDASPGGPLPFGRFRLCYTLQAEERHGSPVLDEDCEQTEVELMSPPQLILPEDSDHVDLPRPLFVWSPPTPQLSKASYDFYLVEVSLNQTSGEAIQQNLPLYVGANVRSTQLQYPSSAPKLDSLKLYAWQVVAKSGDLPLGKSEAWAFRLQRDTARVIPPHVPDFNYLKLSKEESIHFYPSSDKLRFYFRSETNIKSVHIALFDVTNAKSVEVALDQAELPAHYGDNFLLQDLAGASNLKKNHLYKLTCTDPSGEKWYLAFQYKK